MLWGISLPATGNQNNYPNKVDRADPSKSWADLVRLRGNKTPSSDLDQDRPKIETKTKKDHEICGAFLTDAEVHILAEL